MESILKSLTYEQIAIGSLIFLISFILLRRGKAIKLNEPPLVPYKYPIIGHTIEYYKDNENFIKKCHEKYGEIFSLYVFGKVITCVGKELTPEVFRNHEDFNFSEATQETFPTNDFMNRPHGFFDDLPKIVRKNLSGELKFYTERVQRQLNKSIDEIIGDGKVLEPPLETFQFIIAKPIAATILGEELSENKELVDSFAYSTNDLGSFLSIPPILSFINPALQTKFLVMMFRCLNNPVKIHKELIRKNITPMIKSRLSQMEKLGDAYVSPTDILQRYIELFREGYTVDIEKITDYIILTIFASVHTTSRFLTFCLQEWANNPQCHKAILEEQEQLYNSHNGPYYSVEAVDNMKLLNSFVRETFRVFPHIVSLQHKTLSPFFTFSNGYQVPKGRFVYIRSKEIHFDETLQGQNPEEFDAFRHVEKNPPASRTEKNFLLFGLGRHACPGRAFAVNEIKFALHTLLLKYNVRSVNNEKFKPIIKGSIMFPSDVGLLFEKRQS